jgi:hypothetical protein
MLSIHTMVRSGLAEQALINYLPIASTTRKRDASLEPCPLTLNQPNATVEVEAEHPGDPDHMPTSTTDPFVIGAGGRAAVTLTYTGDRTGEFQATADLAATLINPQTGAGIVGDPITFTLGAQSSGVRSRSAQGVWTPPATAP